MTQSATQKRTPLGIEPFWDKPSADPPLKWEKWQMQAKLALLAKENITVDTLLELKPETVQLPIEPIYENTITGSSHNRRGKDWRGTLNQNELGESVSETTGDRSNVWR